MNLLSVICKSFFGYNKLPFFFYYAFNRTLSTINLLYRQILRSLVNSPFKALLQFRHVDSASLPNLKSIRDETWQQAYNSYIISDWPTTVEFLSRADSIEDEAACKIGLDPYIFRIVGRQIIGSIGHMAFGLSLRARMCMLKKSPVQTYLILPAHAANISYLEYWSSYFPHILKIDDKNCKLLENIFWPIAESIQSVRTTDGTLDLVTAHNTYSRTCDSLALPPLLSISEEHVMRSADYLKQLGIAPNGFIVTLHVREGSGETAGYGRNCDINTYKIAVDEIVRRGGSVFRIGQKTSTPFRRHGLYDLTALHHRPSWLDLYLIAVSRFMIATTSGPIGVASSFGVPILWTNAPDLGKLVYHANSLLLPKLVSAPSGSILSISEMLSSPTGWSDSYIDKFLDSAGRPGYKWVDNSPKDIFDGVCDMFDSRWLVETSCQKCVRNILEAVGSSGSTMIGPTFVENYKNVLLP